MKKIILMMAVTVISLGGFLFAGPMSASPVFQVGEPTTVSVSTSAWTEVPASITLPNLTGILVCNISTNTASFIGMLKKQSETNTTSINVSPIEIEPGEMWLQPMSNNMAFYLRSLASSAENAFVQEIRQAP